MIDWFVHTLKTYPEIAIFLSLALGYYFGSFTYKGLGLGAVTATLVAAVIIGQIGITVTGPLKPTLLPDVPVRHRIRGRAAIRARHRARRRSAGMFSRWSSACSACSCRSPSPSSSATISAPPRAFMPAHRRSLRRWVLPLTRSIASALPPDQIKPMLDVMPVAYAVTYIFGTVGSAIILALVGPSLCSASIS